MSRLQVGEKYLEYLGILDDAGCNRTYQGGHSLRHIMLIFLHNIVWLYENNPRISPWRARFGARCSYGPGTGHRWTQIPIGYSTERWEEVWELVCAALVSSSSLKRRFHC